MGVRPPSSDEEESTDVAFGIVELDARLDDADLSYPATATELTGALSNPEVAYDPRGHTVALRNVVERAEREEFDSKRDVMQTLHPVFEELRSSSTVGLWARLRSMFGG